MIVQFDADNTLTSDGNEIAFAVQMGPHYILIITGDWAAVVDFVRAPTVQIAERGCHHLL